MNCDEWLDQLEGFHLVRENFTPEQIQMIKLGWDASRQNISQRECYQRGHKAGFNEGVDEAVKAVSEKDHDGEEIYPLLVEKITEIKK